jgi:hypothetical protein
VSEQRPWHNLFGLSWMDFFHGTKVRVEPEKDLSHKHQLLDLAVVRPNDDPPPFRPPDGFEGLAAHNLFTFKSYQEALDDWAVLELVGHYANYRKQVSPNMRELLPVEAFRLFAVCVRSPQGLAGQVTLVPVGEGVYDLTVVTKPIRVVVIHELPMQPHNAMLLTFSLQEERRRYGSENFQQHSTETSTLLTRFMLQYRREGLPMPETLEEMKRNLGRDLFLECMTTEERAWVISGMPAEKRRELFAALPAEERKELLAALPPEERLQGVKEELKRLSPEERARLLRELQDDGASGGPQ